MSIKAFSLLAVSLAALVIFLIPVTHGILCLGNAAGISISAACAAAVIFRRQFSELIRHMMKSPAGKAVIAVFIIGTAAFIITGAVTSFFMVRAMKDSPPSGNTTLVVLGCKVKNGRPSNMLQRRLDAAYEYLSQNGDTCVIVSGGQGSDELISEALCMKEYLTGRGISPDRIFMEDKSVNTRENLRFSQEIIKREGLPEDITIVTDGFHQLRSHMLADDLGIKAYSISADTRWWLLPTYWVREWFGVPYYALRGA
ncbi:MAG: YdcF family protein [Ruminococcus sp.]|nr:YdcF family protein [Ruminococcus sp.]